MNTSQHEGAIGEAETGGREWDSESSDRIDVRDAENIDLDIECVNETLERKSTRS